jgi:hypothetical protein
VTDEADSINSAMAQIALRSMTPLPAMMQAIDSATFAGRQGDTRG